ncbi:MAG: transporter substrate-binding protein [Frankiales bacterium]|nr:transporter substrate-binding protein [Frankiales bacterium]
MINRSRWSTTVIAVSAIALAATACSSSKSSPGTANSVAGASQSTSAGGSSGSPIKIGVIADLSGAASSGFINSEKGIKAYTVAVNAQGGINGHKIDYVMADSTSTPAGALTAAQKLVQNDKVFAIISDTSDFYGAEPFLLKENVPVIGTGFDGPEWSDRKNTNMFNALGYTDPSVAFTTGGDTVKKIGGTVCGAVGYLESPSSTASVTAFAKSCTNAGLKTGYTTGVHFGSTDVAPVALKMKSTGVDSIFFSTVPATGFALAAALRTVGATTKAILLPTGYGGALLKSSAAVQAAQGFYFSSSTAPVELNTPATNVFKQRLVAVGENDSPGYDEQTAYTSMTAFAAGLKAAGDNPTPASFAAAMGKVNNFDAEGLLGYKVDFSDFAPTKNCTFYVQLEGSKFVPVDGLDPICGTKIN